MIGLSFLEPVVTSSLADELRELHACSDAVEWAEGRSKSVAWSICERGDWMLWYAGKLSGPSESASRRRLVLAACACARLALPFVKKGEDRPRIAIETAERWARQEKGITLTQVRKADAAYAACAADAYAACAADAYAAYAAAYAAADAADAAYAAYAARSETLKQCADIVRGFYPQPPTKQD